jgi:hypothetical protein
MNNSQIITTFLTANILNDWDLVGRLDITGPSGCCCGNGATGPCGYTGATPVVKFPKSMTKYINKTRFNRYPRKHKRTLIPPNRGLDQRR